MSSKNKDASKDNGKNYQPKATARHAKITKTKKEEIESFKKKIDTDKYLAKKYESGRKTEIKALPKEERSAAKAELKESIQKRKDAERRDKAKLRTMMLEEKELKTSEGKEPFDEEAWLKGGKKKGKEVPAPAKETPAPKSEQGKDEPFETDAEDVPDEPESDENADVKKKTE